MKRMEILARRVMLQLMADKRTLALLIVVPIVLLSMAGALIRIEPSHLRVGVVNQDEGMVLGSQSANLGEQVLLKLQDVDLFETEALTTEAAQQGLEDGELDAVITLPPDFSEQVLATQQLTLAIEFEGSNPTVATRLLTAIERVGDQAIAGIATSNQNLPAIQTTIHAEYLHGGAEFDTLDYMASALIGAFVFLFVFILTSISFLRERLGGTLERLQASPIRPYEIIIGYMLGFLVFGLLQGLVTLLFTVYVLNIHYHGNLLTVFLVESLLVVTSVNLGIFFSTFARNEFQVLQFIPLVVVTQVFLGGAFWEVPDMPTWLQPIAYLMPLTHANTALRAVMMQGATLTEILPQMLALLAIGMGVIGLSSQTAGRVRLGG